MKRNNVKQITIRLTADEYTHVKQLSKSSGLKMEPAIRALVMGVNLYPRPPDEYAEIRRQLAAIGNNRAGRCTKWVGQGKSLPKRAHRASTASGLERSASKVTMRPGNCCTKASSRARSPQPCARMVRSSPGASVSRWRISAAPTSLVAPVMRYVYAMEVTLTFIWPARL